MKLHKSLLKSQPIQYVSVPLSNNVDIYDLTLHYKHILFKQRDDIFNVKVTDKIITMSGRWLHLNVIMLQPYITRLLPIYSTVDIIHNVIVDDNIQEQFTRMYECIFELEGRDSILFEFKEILDELNGLIITELSPYEVSLDIFKIAESLEVPAIKEAISIDFSTRHGLKEKETLLKDKNKKCMDVVLDPKYVDENGIYPFSVLKAFNEYQLPQALVAVGSRTDLGDTVIPAIISGNYYKGLKNVVEYVVDSLSARKAIHCNKTGMSSTSYANRKQQLLSSITQRIYKHDCGSEVTIPFYIQHKHRHNVIGININHDGKLVELTKTNIDEFSNKIVRMYLPNTCRHTDGVCYKCGGELLRKYSHDNLAIGPSGVTIGVSGIIQKVLSYKHALSTNIMLFKLNPALSKYFKADDNSIYLKDNYSAKDFILGITYEDGVRLSDLKVSNNTELDPEQFTQISHISLYNTKTKTLIYNKVLLQDKKEVIKTDVYLSSQVLNSIRCNREETVEITDDDMIWIKLENVFGNQYITCPSISGTILDFVKRVERVQSSVAIKKQHSITDLLREFTSLLWEKENTNIVHISIILKASMVKTQNDTQVPIVKDVDDVNFNTLKNILQNRSIGTGLAFEQLSKTTTNPSVFLLGKTITPFDHFVISGITKDNR